MTVERVKVHWEAEEGSREKEDRDADRLGEDGVEGEKKRGEGHASAGELPHSVLPQDDGHQQGETSHLRHRRQNQLKQDWRQSI